MSATADQSSMTGTQERVWTQLEDMLDLLTEAKPGAAKYFDRLQHLSKGGIKMVGEALDGALREAAIDRLARMIAVPLTIQVEDRIEWDIQDREINERDYVITFQHDGDEIILVATDEPGSLWNAAERMGKPGADFRALFGARMAGDDADLRAHVDAVEACLRTIAYQVWDDSVGTALPVVPRVGE